MRTDLLAAFALGATGCAASAAPVAVRTVADLQGHVMDVMPRVVQLRCDIDEDRVQVQAVEWHAERKRRWVETGLVCWDRQKMEGRWTQQAQGSRSRTPLVDSVWKSGGPERIVERPVDGTRAISVVQWMALVATLEEAGFWDRAEWLPGGPPCIAGTYSASIDAEIAGRSHRVVGGCSPNGEFEYGHLRIVTALTGDFAAWMDTPPP